MLKSVYKRQKRDVRSSFYVYFTHIFFLAFLTAGFSFTARGQQTVNGKVTSADAPEGLPGVSVFVDGTNIGVSTDINGNYKLEGVPADSMLTFRLVGFQTKKIPLDGRTTLDVVLEISADDLEGVVVVGYGTQRKETLTGSVATVSSEVFEDRGVVSNPLSALQGQVPGVMVTRSSAAPGQENWNFQIRGATSLSGTSPLIIVDDIPLPNNNALNSINPQDIDNISFLKDASAAIYGARAAGGVVLITTKQAMTGRPRIQYNGSYSQKRMGLKPSFIRPDQYGRYLLDAISNASTDGVPDEGWIWTKYARAWIDRPASGYIDKTLPGYEEHIGFTDVTDYTFFDTNPIDLLWKDPAVSTQHDLSFSARTDVMGYRLSLGYLNEGSFLEWGENSSNRYNIRLNYDYKFSSRFKMKTNLSLERNDVVYPTRQGEINFGSQPGFPVATVNGKPYAWGTQPARNWLLELGGENEFQNNRIFASTHLEYQLADNLKLIGVAGYSHWMIDSKTHYKYIPEIYNYTETYQYQANPRQDQSWYQRGQNKEAYFNTNAYLEYKKKFNAVHEVTLMGGGNYERTAFDSYTTRTGHQASNEVPSLSLGLGDNTTRTNSESGGHWSIGSAFGRLNYAYKDKYLFEAIGRYDGSSRFEPGNKWTFYSGVSAGWRLTEEPFMQSVDFLDELKLFGSYGEVGNNQGVGLYDYISLVNIGSGGAILGPYASRSVTAGPQGILASQNASWESLQHKNIGVDLAFLNHRLFGTFEYFWKRNKNMFLEQTYPAVLGAGTRPENIGDLKVWGWEIALGWRDQVGEVSYYINGTLTDNNNKLVNILGVNNITSGQQNIEGYPIGSYFGLKYDGRIQTEEQAADYARMVNGNSIRSMPGETQIIPGINRFKDLNGDGTLTNAGAGQYLLGKTDENGNPIPDGDIVYLGRSDPRYAFGLNLGFAWRGFDFSAILQGVGERLVYRRSDWSIPFGTIWQGHADWWVGKTWTPDNPDAELPILTTATNKGFGGYGSYNYQISDWSLQDGAYVRLKNIVLGYTLPESISRKAKLERLRVYLSGNDIWEWSGIQDNWDPEQTAGIGGGAERYPFYRLITFGINATF